MSLPTSPLRLLPTEATFVGWDSHPLEFRAFSRRTELLRLSLLLVIWPWSPSTQPGGFSLTLDPDPSEGNQAVVSLDVSPDQVIAIQVFAVDIRIATGVSARLVYDAAPFVFEGFDPGAADNLPTCADSFPVQAWSRVPRPGTPTPGWPDLNRRIRTRTYGGVGGKGAKGIFSADVVRRESPATSFN